MPFHITKTRTTTFHRSGKKQQERAELVRAERFSLPEGARQVSATRYEITTCDDTREIVEAWEVREEAPWKMTA